jgi:hypothetical protein
MPRSRERLTRFLDICSIPPTTGILGPTPRSPVAVECFWMRGVCAVRRPWSCRSRLLRNRSPAQTNVCGPRVLRRATAFVSAQVMLHRAGSPTTRAGVGTRSRLKALTSRSCSRLSTVLEGAQRATARRRSQFPQAGAERHIARPAPPHRSSGLLAARGPDRRRRRPSQARPELLGHDLDDLAGAAASAVQRRCWSRPTTTTRLPLASDSATCLAWSRQTITVKNDGFCSRRPLMATRNMARASHGWSGQGLHPRTPAPNGRQGNRHDPVTAYRLLSPWAGSHPGDDG